MTEPTSTVARIPRIGLMELDLSSTLEREVFVTGTHGEEHLVGDRILEHLNRDGAVYVDVGANVGYHTIRAARHLLRAGGRVVAFEPIQANYDRLLTNLKLNRLRNVRVEKLALADRAETITVCRDTRGSSNASLASTGVVQEKVHLVRFDDWLAEHRLPRLDVIKLDIEGAEVKALRGMSEAIERFRPILVVEINPMWTRRMMTSTTELITLLHSFGYTLFDCATPSAADQQRAVTFVDPLGNRELNVVGIPAERRRGR
jgi:FkbM family methyltransferase